MSPRVWLRVWRIRRARKHATPFNRAELADFIAEVRRPTGFES